MKKLRNPLDNLLKKNSKWEWSTACQKSFQRFKQLLSSDLLLTHFDPKIPIKVAADASNVGLGAYICHVFPDGSEKAIYHASRSLTPAEKNYSQIEKEGLALVFAVLKFHKYIFGRQFTLQTDHKPLLAIFGNKKGIPAHSANRLQRWALCLMSYDFKLEYISTHDFGAADMLSRLINNTSKPTEDAVIACTRLENDIKMVINDITNVLPLTFNMICAATNKDASLQKLIRFLQSGNWPNHNSTEFKCYFARKESLSVVDGCVMYGDRIVVPSCFRKRVLKELHKGHQGIERTKALARSYVYWPHIDDEIKSYIRECSQCASTAKSLPKTTLCSWPLSQRPMERVHLDIAGPIDNYYFLLIIDSYSKWPQIYQIKSISSATIINYFTDFTALFGNPELIVTDNGTQFSSKQFSDFCQQNGILHKFTAPYHPQSNGQAERFVDTLKRGLKKLEGSGSLTENLQTFLKCYRSTPNASINGKSPSELFVGRKIRTNLDLLRKTKNVQIQRNSKMENQFNKHKRAKERNYKIGDKIYAKIYKFNKFIWLPGTIKKRIGNVNYEIEIDHMPDFRAVRSHTNQIRPRYTDFSNPVQHNVLLDYFNLNIPTFLPTTSINNETTESHSSSTNLQTDSSPRLHQDNLSAIPSNNPATVNNETSSTHGAITTSEEVQTPEVRTDEECNFRRSSRRKRPPTWTEDYYLFKRKRDVGNPK